VITSVKTIEFHWIKVFHILYPDSKVSCSYNTILEIIYHIIFLFFLSVILSRPLSVFDCMLNPSIDLQQHIC